MTVDDSIKLIMSATASPDSKKVKSKFFESIDEGRYAYDGLHLNEFEVQAQLECKKDFDDLIHLLQIHKNCFTK